MNFSLLLPSAALLLWWVSPTASCAASEPTFGPSPVDGVLMLAGHGSVPDCGLDAFFDLSGGATADIVVVADKASSRSVSRWRDRGAQSVVVIDNRSDSVEQWTLALLAAEGVWVEGVPSNLRESPVFTALLLAVRARGGAVGGEGEGAEALVAGLEDEGRAEFLPRSKVLLLKAADRKGTKRKLDEVLKPGDGLVGWQIPKDTALVFHHGRRVGSYGEGVVIVEVAGNQGWPERRATMKPRDVFDFGDLPPYELDLLAWVRSAIDRQGPLFPPAKVSAPRVRKGVLVLSGGGGVQSPTWRRFIEAAGGEDATIVCIPSASRFEPGEEPDSYSAKQLRSHGCTNVFVLHTEDPLRADTDAGLLGLLGKATGVWIDGGRTYRVIDAFQHTKAHELMRDVLRRGGAVGGSSAGCQVAGDFLLRGDPRTNRTLAFAGYTTGLGFIEGVIIDAHFRQRNREEAFGELMAQYPQMVGLGVDEDTAVVIEGTTAEVLGMNAVSIYYPGEPTDAPVVLESGQRHDLVKRRTKK